jgi:hypothetical protein
MFVNRAWTQIFVKPCPDEWLTAVEVSPLVNSPKNNTPEVLEPAVTGGAGPRGSLFEG